MNGLNPDSHDGAKLYIFHQDDGKIHGCHSVFLLQSLYKKAVFQVFNFNNGYFVTHTATEICWMPTKSGMLLISSSVISPKHS